MCFSRFIYSFAECVLSNIKKSNLTSKDFSVHISRLQYFSSFKDCWSALLSFLSWLWCDSFQLPKVTFLFPSLFPLLFVAFFRIRCCVYVVYVCKHVCTCLCGCVCVHVHMCECKFQKKIIETSHFMCSLSTDPYARFEMGPKYSKTDFPKTTLTKTLTPLSTESNNYWQQQETVSLVTTETINGDRINENTVAYSGSVIDEETTSNVGMTAMVAGSGMSSREHTEGKSTKKLHRDHNFQKCFYQNHGQSVSSQTVQTVYQRF